MRHIHVTMLAAACTLLAACDENPTAVDEGLVGFWNLPFQETPAIYGLVSAQVIFREDGTFLFTGQNPQSMSPHGEFSVAGTWTRSGDLLTLDVGDASSTWRITFEDGWLRFTDPSGSSGFRLFRPGPD